MPSNPTQTIIEYTDLLWLILVVIWAVAAPFAKKVAFQESLLVWAPQEFGFVVAMYLLLAPTSQFPWTPRHVLSQSLPWAITGATLVTVGLGFVVWARFQLGGNWTTWAAIKYEHELIQRGPYRLVRHPIYAGLWVAIIGTTLEYGLLRSIVAVAICGVGFWLRMRAEEKLLIDQFPCEYQSYRQDVPALIPFSHLRRRVLARPASKK